jgi:hypothetical protein
MYVFKILADIEIFDVFCRCRFFFIEIEERLFLYFLLVMILIIASIELLHPTLWKRVL